MDNQIIIENNKLIAEFMGFVKAGDIYINKSKSNPLPPFWHQGYSNKCTVDDFKFHSSWDWLKPVIDEIAKYSLAYPEQTSGVRNMSIIVEIIPAWKSVVEFIKWYNLNK